MEAVLSKQRLNQAVTSTMDRCSNCTEMLPSMPRTTLTSVTPRSHHSCATSSALASAALSCMIAHSSLPATKATVKDRHPRRLQQSLMLLLIKAYCPLPAILERAGKPTRAVALPSQSILGYNNFFRSFLLRMERITVTGPET